MLSTNPWQYLKTGNRSVEDTIVSATIRSKFLFHMFSEVFCKSCTLGFVSFFPKSVS